MLQIAICDTIEYNRKRISLFCEKFFADKFINYEIQEYASGESLLLQDFPDVLFLEIEMKQIDGILVKEILHKLNAATKIVYVSNKLEKIQEAFGKNVYAFLEKTVEYEIFSNYMKVLLRDIETERDRIFCKQHNEIQKIFYRDIMYIQAHGRYTKIYVQGEEGYKLSDKSLGNWYLDMEKREFLCCHRSYLVNIGYIREIGKEIELVNGVRLPISRERKREFYLDYLAYIEQFGC